MRSMTLTVNAIALALALVLVPAGCGSDDDKRAAAPSAAPAPDATTTTTVDEETLSVTVTGVGPLPTFGDPICAPAGKPCLLPARGSQDWTGDIEGSVISATAAAADDSGLRFAASRIDIFTGTVKGCGTGSFVLLSHEFVNATEGGGDGEIAEGWGTGELAELTGTIEGQGGVAGDRIRVAYRGKLQCNRD
jgi:hypothetical protein